MMSDFLLTLGATALIVGMLEQGYLPALGAFIMMIFFVIYLGVKNLINVPLVSHIIWASFFAILAVVALFQGGWSDALFILARVFWYGLTTILLAVVTLVFRGYIGALFAIAVILALVLFRKLGYELSSKLIRRVFSMAAPLLSFLVLLVTASRGDWRTAVILGSMVLALAAMLWVLAWMLGAFKRDNTG